MGTSYGLKLHSIASSQLLSKVTFLSNKNIVPYIYYIIKFNKAYIQSTPHSLIINEFTIFNIFTNKEYDIKIEPIDIERFLSGVRYTYHECPIINSVLFISNVIKASHSDKEGIVKERMILLGTEKKYLTQINEVEEEVNAGNLKFLFYNFCNESIVEVDFGLFKSKSNNGKIQLGFECTLLSIEDFTNNYLENKAISLFNNTTDTTKERITIHSSEPLIDISSSSNILSRGHQINNEENKENNSNRNQTFSTNNKEIKPSNKGDDDTANYPSYQRKLIPREKYTTQREIYTKIDSNYNYINTNNEVLSQIVNKSSTNSNIILIKSIQLPTSLSIEELYSNAYLIRKPNN